MEKELEIQDESGDKNYFTIIPNYIANHSTANDQALYFQMKKYAGEKGECFTSEVLLREKLGIGTKALKKSIQYLLDHNWIKEKGFKEVQTKGGIQKIRVYSINDIWKLNNDFYKGYARRTPLKDKGYAESNQRVCQKEVKGMPEEQLIRTREEELYNKNAEASSALSLFNLKEEIKILEDSPRRDLNIIAFYMEQRNPNIETKGQLQVFIRRHLRAAKEVKEFSDNQIIVAAKKCKNDYSGIDWTIDTIKKVLTK